MKRTIAILASLWGLCANAFAIEEPVFEVLKRYPQFEIRQYKAYLVAEVVVPGPAEKAGNVAFEYLGGYIFGKNKGSRKIDMTAPVSQTAAPVKIAMTAPVAQTETEGGYLVQFAMPREFTMDSLPEPTSPKVKLREMPQQTYVVLQYSGSWSQSLYDEKLATLKKAASEAGLTLEGEPIFSRYNAPFSLPFLRRNEIWIRVLI
ncbi:SOUL family heme-binding protein [Undibacterium fentianense]|uniref:Heme-binding protein n=1 Tax=Undibacterium fentianense TaxID=2828728 RepID=A0A941IFL3_9BURK|nr:heme-binding protein [Undibacterium fentianense]MBR7800477.1 heme-binding protein [Undibacterium fentianense]